MSESEGTAKGIEPSPGKGEKGRRWTRRTMLADLLCSAVAASVVAFCCLVPIWEMDVFWHLMIGRWICEHQLLPTENVWSAADPSQTFHAVQWLFEVAAASIDSAFGLESLRQANALWLTGTFIAFYILLRRQIGLGPLEALFTTLLLLAAFQDRIRVRPHVINLTIEVGLVFLVLGARSIRRWYGVALLPLFFVWAAIHAGGSWVFLLCFSTTALIAMIWEKVERQDKVAQILLLGAGSASLGWVLSPEALDSMWTIAVGPMGYVREWLPWPALGRRISVVGMPGFVFVRLLPPIAALAFALTSWRFLRRVLPNRKARGKLGVPYELIFSVGLIVLSFVWVRYFYFAVLALIVIHEAWRRQIVVLDDPPRPAWSKKWIATLSASVALVSVILLYEGHGYRSLSSVVASRAVTVDGRYFPVMTTQMLVESGIEARIGTLPNWGGYVSYHGFPELRTTIDGRFLAPEIVLETTERIVGIYEGQDPKELNHLYSALPADFIIMPHPAFPSGVSRGEWMLVAETPVEDLYVRRSAARPDWLRRLRDVVERHQSLERPLE